MMTTSAVPFPPSALSPSSDPSSGGRLVSVDATLPLREVTVEASARGGLSRVVLRQRFRNDHAEPLSVSYLFPLPEDAAVSGYAFTVGERRIVGEVDRKQAARDRFEAAIAEGKTAALLEQERSSLFTQELGNVPPGAEVTAEIVLDQPLRWIDQGSWEWRFPLASAPRYLGVAGRVADASRVAHTVADGELAVRASLVLEVADALAPGERSRPTSPSHGLQVGGDGGAFRVTLAEADGVALDRDLVVRWAVAAATPGATLSTFAPEIADGDDRVYGLLTIVPPRAECRRTPVTRDLIVLLDTSGSMEGAPLDHARRVCLALIDTLAANDQLEMIEFGSHARRWKRSAVAATPANKAAASAWLASLRARGSTEMRTAIDEAMHGLRGSGPRQRQVILVTDGQIGFESEVVASILQRLPVSSRVHTVGVGSSVNRSLTGGAARAGRGVEVIIGLDEDVERAAQRLVARTDAPLVVDVTVSGSALLEHAPARLPDLFAGAPLLVAAHLRGGGGELLVRGRTADGEWSQQLRVDPFAERGASANGSSAATRAFFARQRAEDLEMQIGAGGDSATLDRAIEEVGTRYQIATRLTSWVAVSEEASVDPREPTRRVRVPQNLPHGMSVEGLGLRPAMGMPSGMLLRARASGAMPSGAASSDGRIGYGGPPRPAALGQAGQAPPAPSRPASSGAGGVLRRAMQTVSELLKSTPHERRIGGRVVTRSDDTLIIELTADDGPLDWILGGATATIHWGDGTVVAAMILVDRSTREGTIAQGASARIALALAATIAPVVGNPSSIRLGLASGTVVIVLA